MATPTVAWRTAVRTTTVAGLTAGLLIVGVASAQAAGTPAPAPNSNLLGSLITQLSGVTAGITNGNALSTLLPNGVLGG
ncbi:hypothetical protein [Streptomyces sp. NPDC058295]|uniref:hypothetical protein n=1 Tax=Streptomyces sp. NPDC058295 TaxID=3346431 RepID=UPI0036EEFBD7